MQVVARSQAKQAGLKRYFTSRPCPSGHVAERAVNSGTCCECKRLGSSRWHTENVEHSSAYGKSYREAKGEDLLQKKRLYQKAWTERHPDAKRAADAAYEAKMRKHKNSKFLSACAAKTKKYEAVKSNQIPGWADEDCINGLYELAAVFRRTGMRVEVDHIVPLQGRTVTGFHTHDNLQLMTRHQNASKSNRRWPDMPQGTP
jgi:hypothetical protein